jgi:hypothetical protein
VLIEAKEEYYYRTVMDYIRLNPIRAGLIEIGRGQSIRDYPWSSIAHGYALPAMKRPDWPAVKEGLAAASCADTAAARRRFVEYLDRRAKEHGQRYAGSIPPTTDRRRRAGLAAAGLDQKALASLAGSHIRKLALADLILGQTTIGQSWIADRLAMRSAANVSEQVRRYRATTNHKLPKPLQRYLGSVRIC